MGQATPIRVKRLVRIEIVSSDEIEMAYEAERGVQIVLVMTAPTFREATEMQRAIIQ